ncbi:MAG: DUF3857 domain-containing protein [bacterium]|nr:DUF3857 domain-containing protein [bacterium]
MKITKYSLVLPALLCLALVLQAADINGILKKRSEAAKMPLTDTAILYHGTTITLYNDGRVDREEHIVRYLRFDNAWDDYGDPHLAYDSDRQELEVLISRVHTTDGRKIDTTPNGFNPMVPFGLDLAPDFTHYRQMVVTHLGIETDAVTELKYVIRDKKALYPWSWGEVLLGGGEPVLEREIIIKSATNRGLQVKEENGAPAGRRLKDGDQEVISWKMTNLAGKDFAEAASKSALYLPRVCYSTCPGWDDFTKTVSQRCGVAVKANESFLSALKPLKEIKDDLTRLDSLIVFVKDRIALKNWSDPDLLVTYRTADRTFSTGYGSPADLAALYAAALKELGFEARLYLLTDNLLAVPGLNGRERYSFHIETGTLLCRLDPVHHMLNFLPPQGESYIGIQPAQAPKIMPLEAYTDNRVQITLDGTLASDGSATGSIQIRTTGQLADFEKARHQKGSEFVKGWLDGLLTDTEVIKAQVFEQTSDKIAYNGDFASGALTDTLGGMMRFVFPWAPLSIHGLLPSVLALNHAQRDVPIFLDHAGSIDLELTFRLPDGWKMVSLPPSFEKKTENLKFIRTVSADGQVVKIHETTILPKVQIPASDWQEWRNILLKAEKVNDRTLVLKKAN